MSPQRPHLLLITTDQQRGDCLGIAGHPVLSTPNLDYLGASGAYAPRAYCESPSCIAARRTIISGQTPAHHGMVGYQDRVPWELEHSLPGALGQAGYQTQLVGKLHLWPLRKRFGFDNLILADGANGTSDYTAWLQEKGFMAPDAGAAHGVAGNSWVARPSHLPEAFEHTTWCVNEAMRFLERRDPTQPFFLWLSFLAPHPPLTPPQHYFERYMQMKLPPPVVGQWAHHFDKPQVGLNPNASRIWLDEAAMQRCLAGYYGLINFVDDQVGRLLDYMRRLGLLQDTFVLFTSDHGEMLGDHQLYRKTLPYEGSARVPFMLRAPQWMKLPQGTCLDQVVGLQDVMPTLLDAAGAPIPDTVDGRSVLALLRGEGGWRQYLHGEHSGCCMHYLTDGREKYIWYSQTGMEQFFVLSDDPGECRDCSHDPAWTARVELWRRRLVLTLQGRPERFSDGERLIPGRPHKTMVCRPSWRSWQGLPAGQAAYLFMIGATCC